MGLTLRLAVWCLLIIGAWPSSLYASAVLIGPLNQNLTASVPRLETVIVDASQLENLSLTFTYDSRELDGPAGGSDYFVYGWRSAGQDNELGRINGLPGTNDPGEQGVVNITLPAGAQVSDLAIYLEMVADSAGDLVRLTGLKLMGERPEVPATGSITWTKVVTGTSSLDWNFAFITPRAAAEINLTPTQATATVAGLVAGTYRVTELVSAPWRLSSIDCNTGGVAVDLAVGTVEINLAAGADVVCTFSNSWQPTLVTLPVPVLADLCVETASGATIAGVGVEIINASGQKISGETASAGCFAVEIDAQQGPWLASFVASSSYDFISATSSSDLVEIVTNSEVGRWSNGCRLTIPVKPIAVGTSSGVVDSSLPSSLNCTAVVAAVPDSVTPPPVVLGVGTGRSGRGNSDRELPPASVTSLLPTPQPLVLGEQITLVPQGGVAAGVRPVNLAWLGVVGALLLGLMGYLGWQWRRRTR